MRIYVFKDSMQLDTIDKKILRVVQKNSNVTHENLASIVGLSASACSRRLTNLRKTGVIKKEVAVLNSKFIGPRVSMLVTVTLEREQLNVINAFKKSCEDTEEITQCYYVTGKTDFILLISMPTMEDYDKFVQKFLFENRNVKRFETHVVMDRVKIQFDVPIT